MYGIGMPMPLRSLKKLWKKMAKSRIAPGAPDLDKFDEEWYLFKYPDVASKVRSKQLRSGRQHFIRHGYAEGREASPASGFPSTVDYGIDECRITASGAVFISGWVNDIAAPIDTLVMESPGTRLQFAADHLHRNRREDVEAVLRVPGGTYEHGFWLFKLSARSIETIEHKVSLRSGHRLLNEARIRPVLISDIEMREFVLRFFGTRSSIGNLHHLDVLDLDEGFGNEIIELNRRILRNNKYARISRFAAANRPITKSFITCLYGLPEFLPLQVALFSTSPGFDEVEFIFVNNSPEYMELLEREAKQATHLYDVPITVIHSAANIGFAAANNLAVQYASSDRLLFINPDVLPKDRDWLARHDDFGATDAGKFFGACLYYDDGSAMHAGMYFVRDSFVGGKLADVGLLDTWHFAKGFPDWVPDVRTTRVVPAVTGAFMSIERAHFESLGGFDEDYIFGHYEDGDLCLKSAAAGQPVWYCADVRLWHLEGKGSTKFSHHDGARRVNRWYLTKKWSSSVDVAGVAMSTTSEMVRRKQEHVS